MPERLTNIARQLVAALRRKFRIKTDPAKLPWPPGTDVRVIYHGTFGAMYQLREGARLPDAMYLHLMNRARHRASIQSAKPCLN